MNKDLKDDIKALYAQLNTSEQVLIDTMTKNFSPEEIVQMTTIFSLYQPLLETSKIIQMQILLLDKAGQVTLPAECLGTMEEWLKEFNGLNERLKIFNNKETMQ